MPLLTLSTFDSVLNPWLPPRLQPWVSSHLFSFRRRLFDAVEPADLQDADGRWVREACDSAIAWPVLEQTIKRKHTRRLARQAIELVQRDFRHDAGTGGSNER